LRQLISAADAFDSSRDSIVANSGNAALPVGSAHLYQSQTHLEAPVW
jgi:hypothetical protein